MAKPFKNTRSITGQLSQPSALMWSRAFTFFMEYKPMSYITKACSMTKAQLRSYMRANDWEGKRDALAKQGEESAVATFRKIQEQNLNQVAIRHLDLSQKIDEHLDSALQKRKVGVRQLKDISSTLANTADVAGRIVGLHRLTSQDVSKPMLVQFNLKVSTGSQALLQASTSVDSQVIDEVPVPEWA